MRRGGEGEGTWRRSETGHTQACELRQEGDRALRPRSPEPERQRGQRPRAWAAELLGRPQPPPPTPGPGHRLPWDSCPGEGRLWAPGRSRGHTPLRSNPSRNLSNRIFQRDVILRLKEPRDRADPPQTDQKEARETETAKPLSPGGLCWLQRTELSSGPFTSQGQEPEPGPSEWALPAAGPAGVPWEVHTPDSSLAWRPG